MRRHVIQRRCGPRSAAVWRSTPVAVRWLISLAEMSGATRASLSVRALCKEVSMPPSNPDLWSFRRRSVESFANDLRMGRGVVLGRAVSTLRSVETHPSTLDSSRFLHKKGSLGFSFLFLFPPPLAWGGGARRRPVRWTTRTRAGLRRGLN